MVNRVKTKFINDFVELLIKEELADPKVLRGCTNRFIKKVEKKYNIKLPRLYIDFLLAIGKPKDTNYTGIFDVGNVYFPKPLFMTEMARKYLDICNPEFSLLNNQFVFCWEGDTFHFFSTEEGDDPPVHYYVEKEIYEYRQKYIKTF
jgi:hypothetical protein